MKRVDNFQVLAEMFRRNMKAKLFPMQNFVRADLVKNFGGHVTMGVDTETIHEMLAQKAYAGGLLLADGEQFETLKTELQADIDKLDDTHMIVFDDADRAPEIFTNKEAAVKRFNDLDMTWNVHLFAKIA